MSSTTSDGRVIAVHPNSMAARKWRRTEWRSGRNLWREQHELRLLGQHELAAALRRRAARAAATEVRCG